MAGIAQLERELSSLVRHSAACTTLLRSGDAPESREEMAATIRECLNGQGLTPHTVAPFRLCYRRSRGQCGGYLQPPASAF